MHIYQFTRIHLYTILLTHINITNISSIHHMSIGTELRKMFAKYVHAYNTTLYKTYLLKYVLIYKQYCIIIMSYKYASHI